MKVLIVFKACHYTACFLVHWELKQKITARPGVSRREMRHTSVMMTEPHLTGPLGFWQELLTEPARWNLIPPCPPLILFKTLCIWNAKQTLWAADPLQFVICSNKANVISISNWAGHSNKETLINLEIFSRSGRNTSERMKNVMPINGAINKKMPRLRLLFFIIYSM